VTEHVLYHILHYLCQFVDIKERPLITEPLRLILPRIFVILIRAKF